MSAKEGGDGMIPEAALSDRPILMSAPMVRALLEGRKTQTRRIAKVRKGLKLQELIDHGERREGGIIHVTRDMLAPPRFAPGDRLWVKETWRTNAMWDACSPSRLAQISETSGRVSVLFEAGGALTGSVGADDAGRCRSPIHMPRWASRLTLLVTDVRVERLQDISEADAIAEGIAEVRTPAPDGMRHFGTNPNDSVWPTAKRAYRCLWDSINGPGAWEANPWICAISFRVMKGNIDQEPAHG